MKYPQDLQCTISKILYPMDTFEHGRELRLIQEYFLVTCTLQFGRWRLKVRKTYDCQVSSKGQVNPALQLY